MQNELPLGNMKVNLLTLKLDFKNMKYDVIALLKQAGYVAPSPSVTTCQVVWGQIARYNADLILALVL